MLCHDMLCYVMLYVVLYRIVYLKVKKNNFVLKNKNKVTGKALH